MTYRRERQELNPDKEKEGGNKLETKGESPSCVAVQVLATISDPVCDDETNANHLLSETNDKAPNLGRCNLRLCERR